MASLRHGVEEPGDGQDIRLVVDTMPTLAWSARPDGSAEFHNQRWLDYTGLSAKQALDSGWQVAIHPDDLPRILGAFREALNAGKPYEVEGRFRRYDGEFRWFLFRGSPLRDQSGRVTKWYGTNTDLEERKCTEDALRKSEAYLAEAHRLAKTGSWAYSPTTEKCIYWSVEMLRIFGLHPQTSNLPNREEFLQLVHSEDRDRFNERIDKAFHEKADFVQDYRIVLTDGTVKHIHGIGHPVLDKTGNVVEYVGTDVDVTERKHTEDAHRASEAFLLDAQRLTRTCSWRHEVLSGKVTVSAEGLALYGIEPEDDASSIDFYHRRKHPEDRPEVERAYAAALLGKTGFEVEFRNVLPDGTIKNIRSIGHPILDERGDVVEFVGASIDVTEHHRARADLEKAFEEIKRLKDQLHDENVVLREQIDQAFMFEEIVGTSSALQEVLSRLTKVAPTASVLVSGETGTGKELVARAILVQASHLDTIDLIGVRIFALAIH
jgi:PAS domain S-box-containing protein